MAHEVEQMIFTQDTPWHGIGDYLGDMDGVTLDLIKEKYPVYFSEILSEPLYTANGETAPGVYALRRSHDSKIVGTGGDQLIQGVTHPWRLLQSVDNILGTNRAVVHTLGFLRDGSRMFVTCKLSGEPVRVKGTEDKIDKYLNFCVAFDGTMSQHMLWTPVRVVCANTQRAAISQAGQDVFKIKQTKNAEQRRLEAEQAIAEGIEFYAELQVKLDVLASIRMSEGQQNDALRRMFGVKKDKDPSTRTLGNIETVKRLAVEGVNSDDSRLLAPFDGTAYALWQGATAYADHYMTVRGARTADKAPSNADERSKVVDASLFGAGAAFRAKAWDAITTVSEAFKTTGETVSTL